MIEMPDIIYAKIDALNRIKLTKNDVHLAERYVRADFNASQKINEGEWGFIYGQLGKLIDFQMAAGNYDLVNDIKSFRQKIEGRRDLK